MHATNAIRRMVLSFAAMLVFTPLPASSQQLSKIDRDRSKDMLVQIAAEVRQHYYDPKFHGVAWDAKVQEAKNSIDKAPTLNLAMSQIAWALDALHDSHTFFLPPPRPYRHQYGWEMEMVGDHCFITRVRPHSDAEAKAVNIGDEVLAVNGFAPTRDTMWLITYAFTYLRPLPGLRLSLKDVTGRQRQVDVMAKITPLKVVGDLTNGADLWDLVRESETEDHLMRARSVQINDDLLILKFPHFMFSESEVNRILGSVRKHKALVLDLRGNSGGAVEILKQMVGGMFDHDVKIADRVGRGFDKPMIAKAHGGGFSGKLVVIVDSKSASAAELFARVVQLQKRGIVIGDRSSGSVMEAKHYSYHSGFNTVLFYGASITDADEVITDGIRQ